MYLMEDSLAGVEVYPVEVVDLCVLLVLDLDVLMIDQTIVGLSLVLVGLEWEHMLPC